MQYKGYVGDFEYDDVNHVFSGRVVNSKDIITFHSSSIEGTRKEFETSVDDYISWCVEDEGVKNE